ncbi:hypothetical protein [Amycolatopsis taiwanensis]|uniref:hypothetical protein n=1 Tax=Amycolatopsis taiwanensis TaxID=342230 RepID=UPI0004B7DB8D|nr:hypothetical protein [Amycolatopsis taiwanensis]
MHTVIARIRSFYGQRPLHLLVLLGCFALAGYAALHAATDPAWPIMLAWFLAAVIGHDLVLFPLYALADRSLAALTRRLPARRAATRTPLVSPLNYLRVPALGVGLTFLLFLPGIIEQGAPTYLAATGQTQQPYLARWLLLSAAMFGVSAVAYTLALRRASAPSRRALAPVRAMLGHGERILAIGYQVLGQAGAVASTRALYYSTGEQPPRWHRIGWNQLAEVQWLKDRGVLVARGIDTAHPQQREVPLADPGNLVESARSLIAARPST